MVISRQGGEVRVQEMEMTRNSGRGREFLVPGNTIIVAETPLTLLASGVSCCLAIALADTARQAGALVHTDSAEQFDEPLLFALEALNSRPEDLRIGLSGVLFSFEGYDDDLRAQVAARMGPDKIIYNQLGKQGDMFINFQAKTIGSPHGNVPPAKF